MPSAIVSLKNWLTSFYISSLNSYAPGIAAGFSAWCAIRGGDGVQGTTVVYFGNSNGTTTGWRFVRLADVASATPAPRLIPIEVQVADSAPSLIVATARFPAPLWPGRIHLFGMTMESTRNELGLWCNGTRLTVPSAFAVNLVPGVSGLQFGVQSSDNCRDELVSAAYSSFTGATLAEADAVHAAIFNAFKAQQSGLALTNAISEAQNETGVGIPAESIYEAWSVRGPFLTTPVFFTNQGSDAPNGDLTFSGGDVLDVQADRVPNFSGPTLIP